MLRILDGALDRTASPLVAAVGRGLADAYLFARVAVLGFTAVLPLAGALSASASLDAAMALRLLLVAAAFHVFAYVLNDVMDLPVDRRAPQRAHDPLVMGRVTRTRALGIALAQIPVAALLAAWLGVGAGALVALGGAFGLLGAYDVWGKRCPWPPLIELVQAVGWACLVAFGALTVGPLTHEVLWLCGAVIAFVLLINGVHGGLRDLRNDLACGARTTAILFGARAAGPAQPQTLPPALLVYAVALHVVMFVAAAFALGPPARSDDARWWLAAALFAALVALCAGLLLTAYRSRRDVRRAEAAATAHLYLCMSVLAVPAAADAPPLLVAIVGAVLALPLVARHAYRKVRKL